MDILSLHHISKRFGDHEVIKDLSFAVPEHSIYGFIGENGAGKTTTMKLILGLLACDCGEILVNGEKVTYGQNRTNRFIGYLPDVPEFYGYMTPKEYLKLCGEITGIDAPNLKKQIPELLEMVGLDKADKRIQGFSRGMKQRLGIAQALINQPKLLICDEPTSALDPVGRKEIIDILCAVKDKTTVLFSTHILSDVERICDEIGFLHEGKLAMQGKLEEVRRMRRKDGFEIEFLQAQDADSFEAIYQGAEKISQNQLVYQNRSKEDMAIAMRLLCEKEIIPLRIEMREPTLETVFMEVVSK